LAATFTAALVNQNVMLGNTISYVLPTTNNPSCHTVTISAVARGTSALPAYVTLSGSTFTIAPNLIDQVGSVIIDVTLEHSQASSLYTFTITVSPNLPPAFASALISAITCNLG